MCVCVCVRARARVRVCVCVCACYIALPAYICESASLSVFKQRFTFYLNSNTLACLLHNPFDNYCIKCVLGTIMS